MEKLELGKEEVQIERRGMETQRQQLPEGRRAELGLYFLPLTK